MRLWLFIWVTVSVLTWQFVNSADTPATETSTTLLTTESVETTSGSSTTTAPVTSSTTESSSETTTSNGDTSASGGSSQTTVASTSSGTGTTNDATSASGGSSPITATSISSGTGTTNDVTSASGSSSQTTVASTTTETTTVPQTTTEDLWAEFDVDCDSDPGYCSYKISGPQILINDAVNITQDRDSYIAASESAYAASLNFSDSSAFQNYSALIELFDEIKNNYKNLTDAVDNATAQALNVQNITQEAWNAINGSGGVLQQGGCYSDVCAHPTRPPTTTTTTPRPTTPSVCTGYSCTTFPDYPGKTCTVISGKPICTCLGNLDQTNHCGPVTCPGSVSGLPNGFLGPVWSIGYNGTDPTGVSYGSNRNCLYKIGDGSIALKITFNNMTLDSTAKLTINKKIVPSDKVQLFLDLYFNDVKTTNLQFAFQSGTVSGKGYYFDFTISEK
ncbi:hypothetical protein FO519_000776 [Halicephalobus sp. NKZ332]|nr:hypothetical protein FO519_000776 [Halicephalobus sp. NKZ332]